MKMKRCSHCSKRKSLTAFGKNKRSEDGLQNCCKVCSRIMAKKYRQTHKDDPIYQAYRRTKGNESYKGYLSTVKNYLRFLFGRIKIQCVSSKNRCGHYGDIKLKCSFRSADEFIDYVVNVLRVDPRGLFLDRIDVLKGFVPGNIRFTTRSECSKGNRKTQRVCTSRYKGVCRNKERELWQAEIRVNGKNKHLGRFTSGIKAARAYDAAALKYHGEFALTNAQMGLL